MHLSAIDITGMMAAWLWPFFRIAAFIGAAPIFSNRPVPKRIRVGIAVVLTVVIAPTLDALPPIDPLSLHGFLVAAEQVLIGVSFGFSLRLVFIVLEIAGQHIATLMGLGFAALVDPQNGIEVPVVSNLYIILGTLIFLGFDGHLIVIGLLAESFNTLPVGGTGMGRSLLWQLTGGAGWIFSAAMLMVLPALAALLTVNLAFGVMSRAAPQLNVFAVGFPITMLFGFVIMMLTLPGALGSLHGLFERVFAMMRSAV